MSTKQVNIYFLTSYLGYLSLKDVDKFYPKEEQEKIEFISEQNIKNKVFNNILLNTREESLEDSVLDYLIANEVSKKQPNNINFFVNMEDFKEDEDRLRLVIQIKNNLYGKDGNTNVEGNFSFFALTPAGTIFSIKDFDTVYKNKDQLNKIYSDKLAEYTDIKQYYKDNGIKNVTALETTTGTDEFFANVLDEVRSSLSAKTMEDNLFDTVVENEKDIEDALIESLIKERDNSEEENPQNELQLLDSIYNKYCNNVEIKKCMYNKISIDMDCLGARLMDHYIPDLDQDKVDIRLTDKDTYILDLENGDRIIRTKLSDELMSSWMDLLIGVDYTFIPKREYGILFIIIKK